jgi:hypothetical protein
MAQLDYFFSFLTRPLALLLNQFFTFITFDSTMPTTSQQQNVKIVTTKQVMNQATVIRARISKGKTVSQNNASRMLTI